MVIAPLMTGPYPTASRADRFMVCPASEALPQVEEKSAAASRGTDIHQFLERCATHGREEALAWCFGPGTAQESVARARNPAQRGDATGDLCAAIDLTELPIDRSAFVPEMTLGWKPGNGTGWSAPPMLDSVREAEKVDSYTGRADMVGVAAGCKEGYIGDYKTGRHGKPAAESWQLRSLAVMLRRAYNLEEVTVQLVYIAPDASVYKNTAHFLAEDLDGFEAELHQAFDKISAARVLIRLGGVPKVVMGDHCTFCPAYQACPGKQSLARALVLTPEVVEAEVRAGLVSAETTGIAHAKLSQIEKLVEALRRAVDEAAREYGGAVLPSGRVYGPNPYQHPVFDGKRSWGILEGLYGEVAADAAADISVTKRGVKELARRLSVPGESVAAHERSILAELEAEGGLRYETRTKMGERRG